MAFKQKYVTDLEQSPVPSECLGRTSAMLLRKMSRPKPHNFLISSDSTKPANKVQADMLEVNISPETEANMMAPLSPTASNPNQPKNPQRATLMAVGGFVVGASAMAALIGLHNALQQEPSLRGADTLPAVNDAASSPGQLEVGNLTDGIGNETGILGDDRPGTSGSNPTSKAPSASPTDGPFPTFTPTDDIDFTFPTTSPTSDNFPTVMPTTQKEGKASGVFTGLSVLRSSEVGVRLKMYWEEGYYWQESTKEKW